MEFIQSALPPVLPPLNNSVISSAVEKSHTAVISSAVEKSHTAVISSAVEKSQILRRASLAQDDVRYVIASVSVAISRHFDQADEVGAWENLSFRHIEQGRLRPSRNISFSV